MMGIYKITNIINNKCYIGQSTNLKERVHKILNSNTYKMLIEIIRINDLYHETKLIKKNVKARQTVNKEDIFNPREIFDTKGNIIKNKCNITLHDYGEVTVNHSYKYIIDILNEESEPIGFLKGLKNGKKSIKKSSKRRIKVSSFK